MNIDKRYLKALSRGDLSQWLVHFCKLTPMNNGTLLDAFGALKNILIFNKLFASKRISITKYEFKGATCFYDIPPSMYQQVIETNPNGRRGYGIIIHKTSFWALGGRPVIYTDNATSNDWPISERYRLIYTDLCKQIQSIGHMNENGD